MKSIIDNSNLICITGRPGIGKTALIINETINYAKNNKILYYSFNENKELLEKRILSNITAIGINVIDKSNVLYENLKRNRLSILNNYIIRNIENNNVELLLNDINNQCYKNDIAIVCIDGFSINNDINITKKISSTLFKGLKEINRNFSNKIIVTSSVSRDIESREDPFTLYTDYGILWDYFETIINIYNESYYNNEIDKNINEIILFVDDVTKTTRDLIYMIYYKRINRYTYK